ncbi:MAG: hypothetical protein L0227_17865, partial [Chloroflexi bacterium]|nr:hypothetical protein [Chloroflexota bacterium]
MTNARSGEPWRYPALGFDPLPGDPEIIEALAVDAGIFGERMVECANVLRRAGTPEGWQGKDADAFADELGELPRDLDRCGLAFQGLKEDLNSYHRLFVAWKQKAIDLECDADVEERTIREARLAGPPPSSPTISAAAAVLAAPGPIIGPAPPNPAEEAEARLEAIRAEARALAGQFNRAAQGLATSIEELVEYAPKKPGRSWLDRVGGVVGDVVELGLRMTPIGLAVTAIQLADRLIEELAPFLDELSNLLSSMSSFLGFASALFMWAPGIGPGLATAALITAGGAAAVKTGLYLSGAKDEYGRPYVSGAELRGAYIDVAIEGAGAALGAGAKALNRSETLVS